MNKVHFSSASAEWATPPSFFEKLHREFKFGLDAAASHKNFKLRNYLSKEDDSLSRHWADESDGRAVFCNPPYGRGLDRWVEHAYFAGREVPVVLLLPARTDTRAFHVYCKHGEVQLLPGRLKFLVNGKETNPAPFPSMLTIFRPKMKSLIWAGSVEDRARR